MNEKARWHYRFDNYKRAFNLLRQAMELKSEKSLSNLEIEGVIQRFEYTWELAWKTLKDYLESDGLVLEKITPKAVIVASIEAKIIADREVWMNALDDRNRMNHVYSDSAFAEVVENIEKKYLSLFDALYEKLFDELMNNAGSSHPSRAFSG